MTVLLISQMDSPCSSPVPSRSTLCPLANYIFPLRNPKSLSTNTTSTRSTSINDCEPRISDKDGDVDVEGDGNHDGAANCLVVTTSPNGRPDLSTIHHAANGVSTLRDTMFHGSSKMQSFLCDFRCHFHNTIGTHHADFSRLRAQAGRRRTQVERTCYGCTWGASRRMRIVDALSWVHAA
jgi:hypothetical protein